MRFLGYCARPHPIGSRSKELPHNAKPAEQYCREGAAVRPVHCDWPESVVRSARLTTAHILVAGDPYGTRTRVFAVRGRRPGPLDEGATGVSERAICGLIAR